MAKGEAENIGDSSAQGGTDKLLSRCGSDAAAFAVLYDIYYPKIFSYCVSRVQIRQVAQDLTSAVFISAAEKAYKFTGTQRIEFANWLYSIATSKINEYLTKKQAAEKFTSSETHDSRPAEIDWPSLHIAILKLPLKEQTIVAFRFFENLSLDRIAEITGLNLNAVRLNIVSAVEKLKICDTQNQFDEIVKGLDIDNTTDDGHKERLRTKIIISFNIAKLKKYQFLSFFFAGLTVLIIAGLGLWIFSGKKHSNLISKPQGPVKKANVELEPQKAQITRLEKIRQLAAEKNIAGLLEIIKGQDLAARLLAAKYLAELTDANAIDLMKLVNPPGKTADANIAEAQKILVQVIDKKTKLPIADAWLTVQFNAQNELKYSTDSNGLALLEFPQSINQLQVRTGADGYAPMKVVPLELAQQRSILFELSRAQTIGGLIVDEQLKGIENAGIKIHIDTGLNAGLPVFDTDETLKTDANGIWRCRNFPNDAGQVSIMVTHPDYIAEDNFQSVIIEQLQTLTYLKILEKGIAVRGKTLDWENKPMAATVSRGALFESRNSVICDANGEFIFANVQAGKEIFTAQYNGAAPQILEIDIEPNMPPVIFNLKAPKTVRARIVEGKGSPVTDVLVKVSGWQGVETLNFDTTTDQNGYFQWTNAPADEVLFDFYKPGYKPITNFPMTCDNDYVISLERL